MAAHTPDITRRSEWAHQETLKATVALIAEVGYDRVSIEAIARRAGVGKQTIYRWWSSKGAIALEALDRYLQSRPGGGSTANWPDTGDILADLRQQMYGVVDLFQSAEVRPLYRGLIAAAQSDPDLSRAHLENLIDPARASAARQLAAAQDRGEVRGDIAIPALVDMLWGALYYRLLLDTEDVSHAQVDDALDIVFRGLRPVVADGTN